MHEHCGWMGGHDKARDDSLVRLDKDMDMGVYIVSHQPFWSRILPSSRLLGPQHGETSSCSQNPCSRPRAACVQSCMELASSHIDNNNTC